MSGKFCVIGQGQYAVAAALNLRTTICTFASTYYLMGFIRTEQPMENHSPRKNAIYAGWIS